jgi:3-methylfumaryl-CoA hydratase
MSVDVTACKNWLGRTTEERDTITPRLVAEFRMTFDPYLLSLPGHEVPLGFHWCLAPLLAPINELGPDGHPAKGGFLPPVPLPRRMWAGGTIEYYSPLKIGDAVRRRSTIASIDLKDGRSGVLCFVGVQHDYLTDRGLAIRDLQNIVYRDAAPTAPVRNAAAAGDGEIVEIAAPVSVWSVNPTPTMLFRYSAVTFNGHRIHYDQPYATTIEGYQGLVVHGPLQATLMLNLAAASRGELPRKFTYRGVAPLIAGREFQVKAQQVGQETRCFTQAPGGPVNMLGDVQW